MNHSRSREFNRQGSRSDTPPMVLSSSGPGHQIFILRTRVRLPLGSPVCVSLGMWCFGTQLAFRKVNLVQFETSPPSFRCFLCVHFNCRIQTHTRPLAEVYNVRLICAGYVKMTPLQLDRSTGLEPRCQHIADSSG